MNAKACANLWFDLRTLKKGFPQKIRFWSKIGIYFIAQINSGTFVPLTQCNTFYTTKKIGLFLAFWDFVTKRQHWRKFQFIKFLDFPFLMINEVSKLSLAWWTSNWSNFSELENLNFGTIQFPHSTWFTWYSIHIVIFILTWAFATPMHHNAI